MDLITQGVLGAAVGQAAYRKKLGPMALVAGAVGGFLPDADGIAGILGGSFSYIYFHRGPSHSLWFPFVAGPLLGVFLWFLHKKIRFKGVSTNAYGPWVGVFILSILSHPLLDVCTSYGTQLFAPFSLKRFGINAISILDLFYTFTLLIGIFLTSIFEKRRDCSFQRFRSPVFVSLFLSTAYIGAGYLMNEHLEERAKENLPSELSEPKLMMTDATLLQLFYRKVMVRDERRVCVAYHSVLWNSERPFEWSCFPLAQDPEVQALSKTPEGELFTWFTSGHLYPTLKPQGPDQIRVRLTDIRYARNLDPRKGLWSIQGVVNSDLEVIGPVTHHTHRNRLENSLDVIAKIFKNIL